MLPDLSHFDYFMDTLNTQGLMDYDYFVNWQKVLQNIDAIEIYLNILNSIIGKEDITTALMKILHKYPEVMTVFPILLAVRNKSLEVLTDKAAFKYVKYDFNSADDNREYFSRAIDLLDEVGLLRLIQDKRIKNLVDYVLGVEVGLDSNGRKNRGGKSMEKIVEVFVRQACRNKEFLTQATARKIKDRWGIDVHMDKSSRILDFVINKNHKLLFIECNFYSQPGSKLKSTAIEYLHMSLLYKQQGIDFLWITDGLGWRSTQNPLLEYFNAGNLFCNLSMLKDGYLANLVQK